jgi:DNA-binding PadR family transcriptional regulator
VLEALAANPTEWRHGYDLCREVGLKAGSMYPILIRLADQGLLETAWETEVPSGRPRRHLYRLTPTGIAFAATQAQTAHPRVARPDRRMPHPEGA